MRWWIIKAKSSNQVYEDKVYYRIETAAIAHGAMVYREAIQYTIQQLEMPAVYYDAAEKMREALKLAYDHFKVFNREDADHKKAFVDYINSQEFKV